MAKKKNNYFEMMTKQSSYCVKAAQLLEKMLCDFEAENTPTIRDEIHEIEHKADKTHHKILSKLAAEFITPIDQEDILRLVQIIDDVTDALDEVVLDFYMYNLDEVPEDADEFAKTVTRCVTELHHGIEELKNFKKPTKVREILVKVNSIESDADAIYMEAIHDLFTKCTDAKTLISHKAIYEGLENCCDLCEHASDVIEQIIIKNT